MISITPKVADNENFLVFEELPSSNLRSADSRVSRSATLDGGSIIDNQGFSEGDRTIEVEAELTPGQCEVLWNIFTLYTEAYISFKDGFFSGVISAVNIDRTPIRFTFLIEETA